MLNTLPIWTTITLSVWNSLVDKSAQLAFVKQRQLVYSVNKLSPYQHGACCYPHFPFKSSSWKMLWHRFIMTYYSVSLSYILTCTILKLVYVSPCDKKILITNTRFLASRISSTLHLVWSTNLVLAPWLKGSAIFSQCSHWLGSLLLHGRRIILTSHIDQSTWLVSRWPQTKVAPPCNWNTRKWSEL